MQTQTKTKADDAPVRRRPSRERDPRNTTLTVSMPKQLRNRIEKLATAQDHTVSSWLRSKLRQIVDEEMALLN